MFQSVLLGRFDVDFSIIVAPTSARSSAEAEAAEGGEASPPSSAWVGFSVFALCSARPATSDEVRRIYKLPPLPPASQTWTLGGLEASISIDCQTSASIFIHLC